MPSVIRERVEARIRELVGALRHEIRNNVPRAEFVTPEEPRYNAGVLVFEAPGHRLVECPGHALRKPPYSLHRSRGKAHSLLSAYLQYYGRSGEGGGCSQEPDLIS